MPNVVSHVQVIQLAMADSNVIFSLMFDGSISQREKPHSVEGLWGSQILFLLLAQLSNFSWLPGLSSKRPALEPSLADLFDSRVRHL